MVRVPASFYKLESPRITPEGYLIVDGYATRTGVFPYLEADGNMRLELRPPDEVFDENTMKSMELKPVTLDHPPEAVMFVTALNAKDYQVGTVLPNPTREGDYMRVRLQITDLNAIADILSGEVEELSAGYLRRLDSTPGTHAQDGRYDHVQRGIYYNHLALVRRGRAGPGARLKLDSLPEEASPLKQAGAASSDAVEPVTKEMTVKVNVNGVGYEVDEQLSQALEVQAAADATRVDSLKAKFDQELSAAVDAQENLKAELEKSKAAADVANERAAKAEKGLAEAVSDEAIKARVEGRLGLERTASKYLGKDFAADGLSENDIRTQLILKASPKADLEGKSEDYLNARFDAALDQLSTQKTSDTNTAVTAARVGKVADHKAPKAATSLEEAYAEIRARDALAWSNVSQGAK